MQKVTLRYEDTTGDEYSALEKIEYHINMDQLTWMEMVEHYIEFLGSIGYHIEDKDYFYK